MGVVGIVLSKKGLEKQIHARERGEAVLRDSENRLRIVSDFTYDWEYWRSPDDCFLYVSPSCERVTGYTRGEFIKDPVLYSRIIHPEDRERMLAHLSEDQSHQELCELEFCILRRDGQERWIGHVCQPVLDPRGQSLGRRASDRDITERKRAEEEREELLQEIQKSRDELDRRVRERTLELSRANELLEKMFSDINIMIAYLDRDFNFIRVNRAYAEADEKSPEFYAGKNHFALFPNEENERIFRQVVETGQTYFAYEKPFVYRDHPERLRKLSRQLMTAEESERKRIALEIHDSLGQLLSFLKFRLNTILRQMGQGGSKELLEPVQGLIPVIERSIEECRRIQKDLRPPRNDGDVAPDGNGNADVKRRRVTAAGAGLEEDAFNSYSAYRWSCSGR
jgi:PAS domain S-box-containing protein